MAKSLARLASIRSLAELDRGACLQRRRALVSEGISDFALPQIYGADHVIA